MNKIFSRVAAVASLAFAGNVYASSCSSPYYHPECNPVASSQALTSPALTQMNTISQVLGQRMGLALGNAPASLVKGGSVGMSAGAAGVLQGWNTWASLSYNDLGYSSVQNGVNLSYSGEATSVLLATDFRLSSSTTLGISLGVDNNTVRPKDTDGLKMQNEGYTVAPYIAQVINKNLSVDVSVGWGQGQLKRSGGAPVPYSGNTERMFAGANLSYSNWVGNLQLAGKASILYSNQHNGESNNALSEATKYLGQARVGAQIGYWLGNGVMPYAGVTYSNDLARNSAQGYRIDRDGFLLVVGANYLVKGPVSAGVSYSSELGRNHATNDVLMANVNIRF